MASGIEQEWYDHPATSFLSLYSFFYKIYSIFDTSFIYKIGDIVGSDNPDQLLQKIFFVTRIFDCVNIILIVFFTHKVLNFFSINTFYRYFLISIVVLSITFFQNLSILNPEDWSVLFFMVSFYYFLKYFFQIKLSFYFYLAFSFQYHFF